MEYWCAADEGHGPVLAEIEELLTDGAGHVVQFYDHDHELARAVGAYLAMGIEAGATTIVVATAAHRDLFDDELVSRGIDPAAARAAGRVIVLDAAEMLARFMLDGSPDRDLFGATVGALVRDAAAHGAVRAYGEMVALLWDEGNIEGAIDLEGLWNDLAAKYSFSLFCAYPMQSVAAGDDHRHFTDVCAAHTAVVSSNTPSLVSGDFDFAADSPRAARRFVANTLRAWHRPDLIDDAILVTSELATNALLHARSAFRLTLARIDDIIRIEVQDTSPNLPAVRLGAVDAWTGRGLPLLDAATHRWGADLLPLGKSVWAEISL